GLHLRGRYLQLGPHEESGDSSDVSRGCSVFNGSKNGVRAARQMYPVIPQVMKSRRLKRIYVATSPFSAAC
ncbi:MAG: hypothetical protein WB523_06785, partial [Candidatus Sulfotelmatobacter sp.]